MSDVPSWLNEENINTASKVASNPAVQKAAADPKVQKAAMRNVPPPPPPPPKANATSNPAFDPEAGKPVPTATAVPASNPASEFVIEEETLKQMRNWHLALRLAYVASTVLMCVASVLALQNNPDASVVFFSGYVFCFAVLICCFEFALNSISRLIAVNFGFMYTLSGRMVFLLFVGFMCFHLGTWGIVAMCALYASGLFQFFIMYKFPRFEEYLRKKHYFEGRNAAAQK